MPEPEVKRSSISKATSLEEMGEYWDTHELPNDCPDVTDQFEVSIEAERHLVAIDPDLFEDAIGAAHAKGISVQTLVNLAVRQAVGPKA